MNAAPATRWEQLLAAVSGVSVRTKILGIVLGLTIALGVGVTLQVRAVMTETLLTELDDRGFSVASDLANRSAPFVLDNNLPELERLLAATVANHPDTRYAFVLGPEGQVLADTYSDAPPPELVAMTPPSLHNIAQHFHYYAEEGQMHDFATPILGGNVGMVRLGLAETRLIGIVGHTTDNMLFTTLLVALAGVLAAMALTWLLTRPILDLVKTTERLGAGDLTARAPHWTDDEIGALANAFNRMAFQLQSDRAALVEKEEARSHLLSQLINAQEEERKRIARDLHDDVGQSLTSILVGLKLAAQSADGSQDRRLEEVRETANQTLESVRLLSRQLRPSALDDLGLAAALERYVAEFTSRFPNIEVDLHSQLTTRMPTTVETSLYRIIQEAMTNAARHSGATALSVLISQRDAGVHAIVEDNGSGFDAEAVRRAGASVGLHSMAERAELLGGHIRFESSADGTTVYVDIPFDAADEIAGAAPAGAAIQPEGDSQ